MSTDPETTTTNRVTGPESNSLSGSAASGWAALQAFRSQMPVTEHWAFFDHASVAPLPAGTAKRLSDYAQQAAENGNTGWLHWAREVEETRATAARLINAGTDEIALVTSTTSGINLVAEGLAWQPGDNVVTLADEFPSNLYPWMHLESLGVEVRRLPTERGRLDLDQLAAACDQRTQVVSVSWVGYQTGYRQDLEKIADIAHQAGALFFVDAIQGLGVFPLDVEQTPIDFLAADGHKWMLGPEGAGMAYIRREHLEKLRPTGVGWGSVQQAHDFTNIDLTFKENASRFEGGSCNISGHLAWGRSLKLLESIGQSTLSQAILDYTDLACERLASAGAVIVSDRDPTHRGGAQRSGIVIFELPGRDAIEFRKRCLAAGVGLTARAGKLRISPHGYNNQADLDRLLSVLCG